MKQYDVYFLPDDVRVRVSAGQRILDAANEAGIILNAVCGGKGVCDKCLVHVKSVQGPVRACQYAVEADLVVTIPDSSRFFEQRILQAGISSEMSETLPAVEKHYLELAGATVKDLRSDAARLRAALSEQGVLSGVEVRGEGSEEVSPVITASAIATLPGVLRDHEYRVTAVCRNGGVVAVEGGDTRGQLFGMAVDLGTTTIVAHLVNLNSGQVAAGGSRTNPQIAYGDDVVSRIEYAQSNAGGLHRLQRSVTDCVNDLVGELCGKAAIPAEAIYEITLAGNTTMQHLFAGVPAGQIAQAPYVACFTESLEIPAAQLGLKIHRAGEVYVMPGVAAHVGGDAVAVALATGMGRQTDGICLAIDIGTNGEILLGDHGRLSACSTAAGPAFEGARIRQGMRASAGAIEQVHLHFNEVELHVIGGVKPTGICGSGLIDAIAELLNAGVLDTSGRILSGAELPGDLGEDIRRRVVDVDGSKGFMLAEGGAGESDRSVVLTQRDIREAQLGKAAISAGVATLLKVRGIEPASVDRIYLAGAFGNYIRPESARRIGLLPLVEQDKIQFVGNAAGAGAIEVLRNRHVRVYNECLARSIDYVELAGRAEFMNLYSELMFFP